MAHWNYIFQFLKGFFISAFNIDIGDAMPTSFDALANALFCKIHIFNTNKVQFYFVSEFTNLSDIPNGKIPAQGRFLIKRFTPFQTGIHLV